MLHSCPTYFNTRVNSRGLLHCRVAAYKCWCCVDIARQTKDVAKFFLLPVNPARLQSVPKRHYLVVSLSLIFYNDFHAIADWWCLDSLPYVVFRVLFFGAIDPSSSFSFWAYGAFSESSCQFLCVVSGASGKVCNMVWKEHIHFYFNLYDSKLFMDWQNKPIGHESSAELEIYCIHS